MKNTTVPANMQKRIDALPAEFQPNGALAGAKRAAGRDVRHYVGRFFEATTVVEPNPDSQPHGGYRWSVTVRVHDGKTTSKSGACQGRKIADAQAGDALLAEIVTWGEILSIVTSAPSEGGSDAGAD